VTSLNNETRDIFDDLSHDEIASVINYTRQIACFSEPGDEHPATDGKVTTLAVVELKAPAKNAALGYLDHGAPAPLRMARVVLYRPVTLHRPIPQPTCTQTR